MSLHYEHGALAQDLKSIPHKNRECLPVDIRQIWTGEEENTQGTGFYVKLGRASCPEVPESTEANA
jgi:hypothetical protein